MLLQNSPFRELDALFNLGTDGRSAAIGARPIPMPMDSYRRGDNVWVHLDLPGITADTIDISVERNVLTVAAERNYERQEGDRVYFDERRQGTFRRQVSLGEGLDADNIQADYTDGVLSLQIPVVPQAKPRKITVTSGQAALDTSASETSTDENTSDDS